MTDATYEQAIALAQRVGEKLRQRQMMCAAAESCTGGLIGHLITEVPGCSDYFAGAAVVYSYAAKEAVLSVDHATLLAEGAVSAPVAQQMAQGALRLYAAGVAVAVTGIAGPGGGQPGKPSGTVYLHVSAADGYERGERHVWESGRSGNKLLSALRGLEMIEEYLEGVRTNHESRTTDQ
jgi:PncC family amidohydrolase